MHTRRTIGTPIECYPIAGRQVLTLHLITIQTLLHIAFLARLLSAVQVPVRHYEFIGIRMCIS